MISECKGTKKIANFYGFQKYFRNFAVVKTNIKNE